MKMPNIDLSKLVSRLSNERPDIDEILSKLRQSGYKLVERYNLTSSSLPFSVVRIIIPGLDCPIGL